jgi:hypothetical protein
MDEYFSADNLVGGAWSSILDNYSQKPSTGSGSVLSSDKILADIVADMKKNPGHTAGDEKIKSLTRSMSTTQQNPILGAVGNFIKTSAVVVFGLALVVVAIVQGVKND